MIRSMLFVPGDRPDRMEKAFSLGADALILDLEDSVVSEMKNEARSAIAEQLDIRRNDKTRLFVRMRSKASISFPIS